MSTTRCRWCSPMPCTCKAERPPADQPPPAKVPMTWRDRIQWVVMFLIMVWFVWGSGLTDPFLHT